jgi:hypothetical protein
MSNAKKKYCDYPFVFNNALEGPKRAIEEHSSEQDKDIFAWRIYSNGNGEWEWGQ